MSRHAIIFLLSHIASSARRQQCGRSEETASNSVLLMKQDLSDEKKNS